MFSLEFFNVTPEITPTAVWFNLCPLPLSPDGSALADLGALPHCER